MCRNAFAGGTGHGIGMNAERVDASRHARGGFTEKDNPQYRLRYEALAMRVPIGMNALSNFLRHGAWQKLFHRDALHSLAVTAIACIASAGLLYLFHFFRCWRIAAKSGVVPQRASVVLLFGKRLRDGVPDADYARRIARTQHVLMPGNIQRVLLLGGKSSGGHNDETSEAVAALARLRAQGVPDHVEIVLEDRSIDTLQNLRNARALLAERAPAPVVLISSRYHLARCALLARNLGFDAELCAAEDGLRLTPRLFARLLLEAGYAMWIEVGTRWARLLGHKRMLDEVT